MSQILASTPAWTIPGFLEARENNHLFISGADATALTYKYGTPLFVFSEARIRRNIARLQSAAKQVERPIKFCYASKANSNMAVLGVVREAGIDIEVNSGGELYKALRAGFSPEQIVFNGTSKTDAELDEAVRAGIYSINVDSIYEIELVEDAVRRARAELNTGLPPARIALRLVPEIGTRSHLGLQTALLTSKFGISSSEVLDAFRRGLQHPELIHVCGIHIHVGSQTPDVEPFAEAFKSMWNHLMTIHRETEDIWLLTDAGYNLLLSMNNYKWYYHLISASRACEPLESEYKVAGPLCDSGDVYFDIERHGRLPDYRLLPRDVKPGEVLALLNSGAYSLAQMFPYNGRPLPAAVMIREGGKADLIRRKDTYDDLVANDVW